MRTITVSMVVAMLSACATVQVTPLNAPSKPLTPRGADEVEMFLTKTPQRAYQEVYMIRSDAGDSTQALKALRKEAGSLGCDGVVITGSADRVVTAPDASGNATVSMREGFLGACIVFE